MNVEIQNQRTRFPFTKEEDDRLVQLVNIYGNNNWDLISTSMQNGRTPRQCRDRWINWINVSFVKETWSPAEDSRLIEKVKEIGPHWKAMEPFFPGRVSYTLRNRFSKLKKMVIKNGNSKLINETTNSTNISLPVNSENDIKIIEENKKFIEDCQTKCTANIKCELSKIECPLEKENNQARDEAEEDCNDFPSNNDHECSEKKYPFKDLKSDDDQGFDWSENSWCRCTCPSNI